MNQYSRFRVVWREDRWNIEAECGLMAPEPNEFPEDRYAQALRRSDDLNSAEQLAMIRADRG